MSHRDFSERFLAALRTGDTAMMGAMLHPDFELIEADSLPYGGTYRGLDGWLALTRAVGTAFAGFRLTLLDVAGEGPESIVLHFAIAGRIRATGVPFESRVLEYWRFRDGKLWRIDPFYFDTHLIVAATDAA
jgi:uncharacterized protein